jgi:acyl carrier protein
MVRAAVRQAIALVAEVDEIAIDDTTDLTSLGLDSLDLSAVLVHIEDAVGEEIPAGIMDRLADVGDIVFVTDVDRLFAGWHPRGS